MLREQEVKFEPLLVRWVKRDPQIAFQEPIVSKQETVALWVISLKDSISFSLKQQQLQCINGWSQEQSDQSGYKCYQGARREYHRVNRWV